MGVNITTIDYLRVLIIEIGSTIILMVVEAQGYHTWILWGKEIIRNISETIRNSIYLGNLLGDQAPAE